MKSKDNKSWKYIEKGLGGEGESEGVLMDCFERKKEDGHPRYYLSICAAFNPA